MNKVQEILKNIRNVNQNDDVILVDNVRKEWVRPVVAFLRRNFAFDFFYSLNTDLPWVPIYVGNKTFTYDDEGIVNLNQTDLIRIQYAVCYIVAGIQVAIHNNLTKGPEDHETNIRQEISRQHNSKRRRHANAHRAK